MSDLFDLLCGMCRTSTTGQGPKWFIFSTVQGMVRRAELVMSRRQHSAEITAFLVCYMMCVLYSSLLVSI